MLFNGHPPIVFHTIIFVVFQYEINKCEGIIVSAKWRKQSTRHLVSKRFTMAEECSGTVVVQEKLPPMAKLNQDCGFTGQFEIHQNTIIRTGESQAIGGKYLQGIELRTPQDCQRLCCQTENCDVYIFETKNNGYCYLFTCGPLDNFHCKFTHHANYTSAVLNPRLPVSHGNKQPPASTKPPSPTLTPMPLSQQEWELLNLKGTPPEESHQHSGPSSTIFEPSPFGPEFSGNPSSRETPNHLAIGLNGLRAPKKGIK